MRESMFTKSLREKGLEKIGSAPSEIPILSEMMRVYVRLTESENFFLAMGFFAIGALLTALEGYLVVMAVYGTPFEMLSIVTVMLAGFITESVILAAATEVTSFVWGHVISSKSKETFLHVLLANGMSFASVLVLFPLFLLFYMVFGVGMAAFVGSAATMLQIYLMYRALKVYYHELSIKDFVIIVSVNWIVAIGLWRILNVVF